MSRFDDELDYSIIKQCRLCDHAHLDTVLDFGLVPLANAYPKSLAQTENYYPLTVVKCQNCGHVQLRETMNPDVLFAEYSYASSDSPSLIKHFKEYATTLADKIHLNEYDSILEIGSNDGILLRELSQLGYVNLYGVEPASNIAERSMGCGAVIINKFFDEVAAKAIMNSHGRMSVICANNVFAHVANLKGVMQGVSDILTEDGVFVFENAYLLDTIQGLYFDQVYHEHLQYYGIKPLEQFLNRYGFEIFDIQHIATQGGSFRIFAKRKQSAKWSVSSATQDWINKEEDFGLYDIKTYHRFSQQIDQLAYKVQRFVREIRSQAYTLSCYGCPAKFALFSKVFGLTPLDVQYVVDDSPLKHNRYSPGKKIPIVNGEHFRANPTDYTLVAVWNMAEAVMSRNKEYKGKWIIPMPNFEIK